MRAITVDTTKDKFVISIDRDVMNKKDLMKFVDRLSLENLVDKADFSAEIEKLGEEIKEQWWKTNKHKFIPKHNHDEPNH